MAQIEVSIPVTRCGYTGQRDAWEQHERPYKVTYDGKHVYLQPSDYGSSGVVFSEAELKTALDFIRDNGLTEEELTLR